MFLYLLISLIVVIIDQITKLWAVTYLQPITEIPIIDGVLYFTYSVNYGAAFGMLSNNRWVFIVISAIVIAFFLGFFIHERKEKYHPMLLTSFALVLGGGIGNMIDRIFRSDVLFCGGVVDFIDFRLINFAIFNMADTAVTIGECLLFAYVIFIEYRKRKETVNYKRIVFTDEKKI